MQLEVLIVTPSGPFGELIRFSLDADPEFHCAMLDNSGELRTTLQEKPCNAVIYDCSFPQPVPGQVVTTIHDEFPGTAILLIPADNRSESNIPADGWVTRPFDSSTLPDTVKDAITKKLHPETVKFIPKEPERKPSSWWNAFQSGIRETAADNGLMVQNGLVIASTPNISTALQQQVTASVLRFWNPEESSDLMRYVKDLVNGQEWMMYATKAAENAVLVLLYLPQTPVTRVRAQTLKLARDIAGLMNKPAQDTRRSGIPENAEPPRLHEILDDKGGEATTHVIKNGFPVEWFRESDLPDFQSTPEAPEAQTEMDVTPETPPVTPVSPQPENEEALPEEPVASGLAEEKLIPVDTAAEISKSDFPEPESEQAEIPSPGVVSGQPEPGSDKPSTPAVNEPDLGMFQAVSLKPDEVEESGLDEIQPVSLEPAKPEIHQEELSEPVLETPLGTESETRDEPAARSPFDAFGGSGLSEEKPAVTRDEVEEALSILSNRLNMENPTVDESGEGNEESIASDAHKILSETDSTGIDVASFQAELSKLEFNDTWAMPEILTGSPQEPSEISTSESEEMATFLAGIEAQTPRLDSSQPEEPEAATTSTAPVASTEPIPVVQPKIETPQPDFSISGYPVETQVIENEPVSTGLDEMAIPIETTGPMSEPAIQVETELPDGSPEVLPEPVVQPEVSAPAPVMEVTEPEQPVETSGDLFFRMNQLEEQGKPEGMETYTVALIPGAENLYLQRPLAAVLSQTMNRLALAFNWTLESLTIRPTYMQWTLSMPATLPPEDMIRIVRKETTTELKKANPEDLSSITDDYWFPQTMRAAGKDFVPSTHWQDFILRRKTREIA
jgi:hypothetical protein